MGSTCLDEWSIGVSGVACGMTLMMTGSGYFSIDNLFFRDRLYDGNHKALVWFTSGRLPVSDKTLKRIALWFGLIAIAITLWSYQVMHGGLHGHLYNYSKKPDVEIINASIDSAEKELSFEVFRISGPDTYGAFIILMEIIDNDNNLMWKYEFAEYGLEDKKNIGFAIDNIYISKVRMTKYSLELPLGAKAIVTYHNEAFANIHPGIYYLKLTDISGKSWTQEINLNSD